MSVLSIAHSWLSIVMPFLLLMIPLISSVVCVFTKTVGYSLACLLFCLISVLVISWEMIDYTKTGIVMSYSLPFIMLPLEYRIDIFNASLIFICATVGFYFFLLSFSYYKLSADSFAQLRLYRMFLIMFTALIGSLLLHDALSILLCLTIIMIANFFGLQIHANLLTQKLCRRYLQISAIGLILYCLGITLLFGIAGSFNFSTLIQQLPLLNEHPLLPISFIFIVLGLLLLLSPIGLHFHLPYLYAHSHRLAIIFFAAAVVPIILCLLIRYLLLIFDLPFSLQRLKISILLSVLGILGIIIAPLIALKQKDFYKILAYCSITQIAYMLLAISLASHNGMIAMTIYLFHFMMLQTCLLMCCLAFQYRLKRLNTNYLSGIVTEMPITFACLFLSLFSIVGLPFTTGFINKWYLLASLFENTHLFLIFCVAISSGLMLLVVWRLLDIMWLRPRFIGRSLASDPPLILLLPILMLTVFNLYLGVNPLPVLKTGQRFAQFLLGA